MSVSTAATPKVYTSTSKNANSIICTAKIDIPVTFENILFIMFAKHFTRLLYLAIMLY